LSFRDSENVKVTAPTKQSVVSPSWNAIDFLMDFNTREKRLSLLMEILTWMAAIMLFRRTESETMYLAEPTPLDRRYHKSILAALISEGERLLSRLHKAGGFPDNADGIETDGIETDDIEAAVEELRNTHAQWYGDMTPKRRAEILEEVSSGTMQMEDRNRQTLRQDLQDEQDKITHS
jgi:hypothetical protein